jgi:hypothetical protein
MGEDLPAQPAARDSSRDADTQGDPGQRDGLPAQRAADLPGGETERPQDREVALPPAYRGHQQMGEGQQGNPGKPDAEHLRQVLHPTEVEQVGRGGGIWKTWTLLSASSLPARSPRTVVSETA